MKNSTILSIGSLFLFSLFFSTNLSAGHILGSQITYTSTLPNQYNIVLKIYRDCSADPMDPTYDINWESSGCGINGTVTLNQSNVEILDLFCSSEISSCGGGGGTYGIESYTYTGLVNFPPNSCSDIILTSEICCRSGSLTTINSSGNNQDQFVYTKIDNTLVPWNNSVEFVDDPAFYIYTNPGTPTIIQNEVLDIDGDSIVYSFVDANKNSTNIVNYNGGYNGLQPLGAGVATINTETGDITLTNPPAMVATIAILVKEFRNGVFIGEVKRDWVLTVLPGSNATPSLSGFNNGSDTSFTQCTYTSTCRDIIISDLDLSDVLSVTSVNPNSDISITVSGPGVPAANQLTVYVCSNSLTPGIYYFDILVIDDHCPVYATTKKTFSIEVLGGNTSTDTRTECAPFTWIDGISYTANNASAMFTVGLTGSGSCDSIRMLDLTIINPTTGTDTRTECAPFVWIDGNSYSADNSIATHNMVNGAANGCDSLITLNLTIINPTTGTDTRTECAPFVWIDGNSYSADNSIATHNMVSGAANGCDSLVSLDLTIQNIDVTTTTTTSTISSNATSASYKWLDCNSNYTEITGETNQSFTATSNGSYAVEVTMNNCADTSSCFDINNLGLDENSIANQVSIFPNPSSELFNIDFGNLNNISLYVTDINGKKVYSKTNINGSLFQFRLNELAGIYFLEVRTKSSSHQFKIIKK